MKLFFRTLAIVMTALLAVYIVGCGGDDGDDNGDPAVIAAFSSADPADGGSVAANGSIKVTFDKNPGEVMASAGTVSGAGSSRTISGPFTVGSLALEITWTNGDDSQTLNYTITEADETAPAVASSDPENGAKDLDPASIEEITVTFTESVTGSLALMDGDTDVGWASSTEGDTITLTIIAGKELSNETEYMVVGTVADASGNEADVEISFTTKAKE